MSTDKNSNTMEVSTRAVYVVIFLGLNSFANSIDSFFLAYFYFFLIIIVLIPYLTRKTGFAALHNWFFGNKDN